MITAVTESKELRKSQLRKTPKVLTQVITLTPKHQELRVAPEQSLAVFRSRAPEKLEPMPQLPKPNKFAAERTSGWISRLSGQDLKAGNRIEIELPFGTPRFITAVTLKLLLRGKRTDMLLKRAGHTWTICADDLRIDLTDKQTEFRLGQVAVYS